MGRGIVSLIQNSIRRRPIGRYWKGPEGCYPRKTRRDLGGIVRIRKVVICFRRRPITVEETANQKYCDRDRRRVFAGPLAHFPRRGGRRGRETCVARGGKRKKGNTALAERTFMIAVPRHPAVRLSPRPFIIPGQITADHDACRIIGESESSAQPRVERQDCTRTRYIQKCR